MSELEKFEKFCIGRNVDPNSIYGMRIWEGWQAALSTRKTYGYVVADKNDRFISAPYIVKEEADVEVSAWNESDSVSRPFRVVPLFYEDSES